MLVAVVVVIVRARKIITLSTHLFSIYLADAQYVYVMKFLCDIWSHPFCALLLLFLMMKMKRLFNSQFDSTISISQHYFFCFLLRKWENLCLFLNENKSRKNRSRYWQFFFFFFTLMATTTTATTIHQCRPKTIRIKIFFVPFTFHFLRIDFILLFFFSFTFILRDHQSI